MERPIYIRLLSIQDENSAIHHKKAVNDGKSKSSKPNAKKGGAIFEARKALNDITNKKPILVEASAKQTSKKAIVVEDENLGSHVLGGDVSFKKKASIDKKINLAEERFLHDHNKCINAQKASGELNFWDTVLPGHGSAHLISYQIKSDPDNFNRIPELEELYMSEFSEWESPPTSPLRCSPPDSPFAWDLALEKLTLKKEMKKEDDSQFHRSKKIDGGRGCLLRFVCNWGSYVLS